MPRHHHVRLGGQAHDVDGDAPAGEVVELVDEDRRVDDAARPDDALLPPEDPRGHVSELDRLAVGDDRVPGAGPAVVAADDVRVAREQVDDLALALVSPLRADDHRRGHARSLTAGRRRSRLRGLAAYGFRVNAREAPHANPMPAEARDEADVGFGAQRATDHDRRPRPVAVAGLALGCECRRGVANPDDLRLRPLFLLSSYSGSGGGLVSHPAAWSVIRQQGRRTSRIA